MRHNDYPTTLLMEPAANEGPSRYRMTPAASTVRAKREEPTSAELTAAEDYWHACHMFEAMAHDMPAAVVSFHPGEPPIEADTPAPAAQECAKPAFAVGCRVVVLPHPDGGRHPEPFLNFMSEYIGKSGTVKDITPSGNIRICLGGQSVFIFPPSSLATIQA